MAHYAEIVNGRVVRVTPVANERLLDGNGVERGELGKAFIESLLGGTWVQTSYNGNIRGKYAGIGDEYDDAADAFIPPIPPQPFLSWTLEGREWVPPTPQPSPAHEWDGPLDMWVDGTGRMDPATFALRFSATEQARIQASADPEVQGIFEKLKTSPFVRPRSPVTVGAIDKLLAKGMLDHANRPAEILNPTP